MSNLVMKEVNKDLLAMSDGIDIPCDLEVAKSAPPWLDKDLFLLGQKFFWNNPYPILVCSMRSLLIGMSLPNLCIPLVLTKKSETKEKARSRYALKICLLLLYIQYYNCIPVFHYIEIELYFILDIWKQDIILALGIE